MTGYPVIASLSYRFEIFLPSKERNIQMRVSPCSVSNAPGGLRHCCIGQKCYREE